MNEGVDARVSRIEQALSGYDGTGGLVKDVAALRSELKDEVEKAQSRWDRMVLGLIGSGVLVIATTVVSAAVIPS